MYFTCCLDVDVYKIFLTFRLTALSILIKGKETDIGISSLELAYIANSCRVTTQNSRNVLHLEILRSTLHHLQTNHSVKFDTVHQKQPTFQKIFLHFTLLSHHNFLWPKIRKKIIIIKKLILSLIFLNCDFSRILSFSTFANS